MTYGNYWMYLSVEFILKGNIPLLIVCKMFVSCHFTNCKLAATCPLKLQLAPPGTPAVVFHKVKCKLAKPDKNC